MRSIVRICLVGLMIALVLPAPGGAADLVTTLTPDGHEDGLARSFGTDIDIDGDTMIVGSWGTAHVFVDDDGWRHQATLSLPTGANPVEQEYGLAVAVDDDTAVVAARADDGGAVESPAVYVFVRRGTRWQYQARIVAALSPSQEPIPPPLGWSPYYRFGQVVDVEGDTLAVGSWGGDDASNENGYVHVFQRTGTRWGADAVLSDPSGSVELNGFGGSVALDGEDALVAGSTPGLQMFQRTAAGWAHRAVQPDAQSVITIDGDTMLARERVLVRDGDTWAVQQQLSEAVRGDLHGDVVVLRARTASDDEEFVDQVWVRDGTTWILHDELAPAFARPYGDVAVDGLTVARGMLGTPLPDGGGVGAVEIHTITRPDWDGDGIADTLPPADRADCRRDRWRQFNNPTFADRRTCRMWVSAHA